MMQNEKNFNAVSLFHKNGAAKVRAARAWLKWSLDEAAKATGLPRTYISYYENGRNMWTAKDYETLFKTFKAHGLLITEDGLQKIEQA